MAFAQTPIPGYSVWVNAPIDEATVALDGSSDEILVRAQLRLNGIAVDPDLATNVYMYFGGETLVQCPEAQQEWEPFYINIGNKKFEFLGAPTGGVNIGP